MNHDSQQVRRIAIAYLFPSSIRLERKDNLAFYDCVTGEGIELPEMQQLPEELVMLNRRSPDYLCEVRVGLLPVPMQTPGSAASGLFRFLVAESGSHKAVKLYEDMADTCFAGFEHVWGSRHGFVQMVEVAITSTMSFDGAGGARAFVTERLLRNPEALRNHLGRDITEFAIKLGSGMLLVGDPSVPTPMSNAQLDLAIETVPQDPRLLVANLTAKWHGVQIPVSGIPEQVRASIPGKQVLEMNRELRQPSEYVREAYAYLTKQVVAFLADVAR